VIFLEKISQFVYNVLLFSVKVLLVFFRKSKSKIGLFASGQSDLSAQLKDFSSNRNYNQKLIWFHCASLGEFEQGRPVIEAYKAEFPNDFVLLTFFSPSGYDIRKNYALADKVMYMPLDTPGNAQAFVKSIQPDVAVFVKYEIWPNFIKELKAAGALVIGISMIFRESQIYFKYYGSFFRKALFSFDRLFVQNKETADILVKNGFTSIETVGDTRFDRVWDTAQQIQAIKRVSEFVNKQQVMVVGSAWAADMQVLLPVINAFPELKFIIAPHEIHEEEISDWRKQIHSPTALFSDLPDEEILRETQVAFVDSIGMLSKLYQYATYAYIGGAFGKGLHNTLEAAVFGVPVFFGNKNFKKFDEAVALLSLGVAFSVDSHEQLHTLLSNMDAGALLKIKKDSEAFIEKNKGATAKIMHFLQEFRVK
jgi:3-deoxy-D-manno-octulosonic-acid transferase